MIWAACYMLLGVGCFVLLSAAIIYGLVQASFAIWSAMQAADSMRRRAWMETQWLESQFKAELEERSYYLGNKEEAKDAPGVTEETP